MAGGYPEEPQIFNVEVPQTEKIRKRPTFG